MENKNSQKWYHKANDPMALIFYMLFIASLLTYIIPAGEYVRLLIDGRTVVEAGSYHHIEQTPVGLFDTFVAIPRGLVDAGQYLFIAFIAGGLFHILSQSGALENAIGTAVKHIGLQNRTILIFMATYIYGIFGIAVGFENNIALIPVAIIISSALGFSNMVGVCIAVGGIGIGFALSPINPYTVGTAQTIAELPLFSGAGLRSLLVFITLTALGFYTAFFVAKKEEARNEGQGLSKDISEYSMGKKDILIIATFLLAIVVIAVCSYLSGIPAEGGGNKLGRSWYINEIAAVFIIVAVITAFIYRFSPNQFVALMMEGASKVTAGALVIGLAASIKIVLIDGHIIDTIIYSLSSFLDQVPTAFTAIVMSIIQGIINLFIPGGSGQALATMPVLIPVADLIGMSRQLMVLSFQVGDGLTNLIVPTSGGTLAMLALGGVSYGRWVKVITPFMFFAYGISWLFIFIAYTINW